jgi:hypothetical protein
MEYSRPLFWLEMVVLICCVVLSTKRRHKSAMWVAIIIAAHDVLRATHDYGQNYGQTAVALAICTLIYLGLLKESPDAARVWLCAGGALVGAHILVTWNVFGLIWAVPIFAAAGMLIGFWVVYRWTEPAQLSESQPHE